MNFTTLKRNCSRGYALVLTLFVLGISLLLLAGIFTWTSSSVRNTDRNNEYYATANAAEAATEKILVRMSRDYLANDEATVYNNLASYRTNYPNTNDSSFWGNYTFLNPNDGTRGTWVNRSNPYTYMVMDGDFAGLAGQRATYYVSSRARLNGSRYGITAGAAQWIGIEQIYLYQFAIFYNMDLEIEPSPPHIVAGRVHSNSNIFLLPASSLTFQGDITAAGVILSSNAPLDPRGYRTPGPITFGGQHYGGTSTLNLPIGTNSTTTNIYALLQIPPAGESITSSLGKSRFYNQADVIILINASNVVSVTSGIAVDNTNTVIPTNQWMTFLNTNIMFWNARESITARVAQVDVGKYSAWALATTNVLALSHHLPGHPYPDSIYIADLRPPYVINVNVTTNHGTHGSVTYSYTTNIMNVESGVRLANATQLPGTCNASGIALTNSGLTVVSPNPIYIWGNFNITTDGSSGHTSRLTNDTTYTYPSAVIGDAITVLSPSWQDGTSASMTTAADTTVNTAMLGGIVPTTLASYSGGVENFPRFLEDWSNNTFWYNGSMVVMFASQVATATWSQPSTYYNPPTRNWAFDTNFNNGRLPPITPKIFYTERLQWSFRPPTIGVSGAE